MCSSCEEFFCEHFSVETMEFAKQWGMLEIATDTYIPSPPMGEEDINSDLPDPQVFLSVLFRFVFFRDYTNILLEDDVPPEEALGMSISDPSGWELGQIRRLVPECREDEKDALLAWGLNVESMLHFDDVNMERHLAQMRGKEELLLS